MMVHTYQRRTREFRGPAPHSVAIRAKEPRTKPADYLIVQRRKEDEQRQNALDMTSYNKTNDLKNEWENWTDKKIQIRTVQQRMKNIMQTNQHALEERREKLRQLLAQEEASFTAEMSTKEETVLERQAKMRERAKQFKERREAERLAVVQQKLEQQWKDQCEELRSNRSKRMHDQVVQERMEQLTLKDERVQREKQEEQMFADMWHADMMAKARREEAETQRQMSANRETVSFLQKQRAALEARKLEERSLKEEEKKLMEEQKMLRKLEEQKALEDKHRRAQETREMLDRTLRTKMEREARAEQEQLAFDKQLLEEILEASKTEAREQAQRKRELKEEDQRYRTYLEQLKVEEKLRERELERLCDIETDKMWQKKIAQWKLEKQARKQLLEDVLASRQDQVAIRLAENERKMAEAQYEREEIQRKIKENQEDERNLEMQRRDKNMRHKDDLLHQIKYNERGRDVASAEDERMLRSERDAEQEYKRKLEDALAEEEIWGVHPFRRAISGRRSAPNYMHTRPHHSAPLYT